MIDPKTRAAVLTDQVQARYKDAVLGALGELATRVRSSLGESLAGLPGQVKPLPIVTTSSLAALKLYAEGLNIGAEDYRASNALLREAIALDADFALAYAELGRRYYLESGCTAREEAEQLFAKALRLTDRLSLRERLWIQAVAEDSRGNREQAAVAYKPTLRNTRMTPAPGSDWPGPRWQRWGSARKRQRDSSTCSGFSLTIRQRS